MKYFTKELFVCKCGCGLYNINPELLLILDSIRQQLGQPIIITSGCRCKQHNKKVGGVIDSLHLTGNAVDIKIPNGKYLYLLMNCILNNNVKRIGINFFKLFVHIDISETKYQPTIFKY